MIDRMMVIIIEVRAHVLINESKRPRAKDKDKDCVIQKALLLKLD